MYDNFTVQYLEGSTDWSHIPLKQIRQKLLDAGSIVPIQRVLVGWGLPVRVLEVCRQACDELGATMWLWHPLLTGDGVWQPDSSWRVVGANDAPVGSYQDMAEFAFVCPNQQTAQASMLAHLRDVTAGGLFDGVFLDRMRFPSPAPEPFAALGCFCNACQQLAMEEGLALSDVRETLQEMAHTVEGQLLYLRMLLEKTPGPSDSASVGSLAAFLAFRCRSISRWIGVVSGELRAKGLGVGLDCFSPVIARMVGQDLQDLESHADWVKVMTYGHVYAPAGIPGELLGWLYGLTAKGTVQEADVLAAMSDATGLPLPQSRHALETTGLSSQALREEALRARRCLRGEVLAGIELVALEGVTRISREQIQSDTRAFCEAGVDGLALSWDLWHIPQQHIEWVAESAARS